LVQPPDFVAKAVDVAISELIAIATPGEGMNHALIGGKT
jgi:mitochondrial-processing peptidase subunit alpha